MLILIVQLRRFTQCSLGTRMVGVRELFNSCQQRNIANVQVMRSGKLLTEFS